MPSPLNLNGPSSQKKLKFSINKKLSPDYERKKQEEFLQSAPEPILPSLFAEDNFDFIDLAPLEVARQLTLIEFELFKKVTPKECLGQGWGKDNKEEIAPNIFAVIQRFNSMSNWVSSLVVKVESKKLRAALIGRFIEIAEKCYDLNNLNSAIEIIAGLGSSAVHRLKKTWALVSPVRMGALDELRQVASTQNNYKLYRDRLHNVELPCLPYLGVYLTDLTFIHDGTPDNKDGLIYFAKRAALAKVVKEIRMYQQVGYCLRGVPAIQAYLYRLDRLTEDECFELSLKHEPRQPKNS